MTRSILFEAACDDGAAPVPPPAVAFRFGGAADVEAFTQEAHEYGEAEKRFGFERLDRGDSLVVGESDGEVVFYAWLMYGQIDLDQNVCVPVVSEGAYSYKVFSVKRARGLHICVTYYSHIKRTLRQQGFRHLICRIAPDNVPSIRAHARVGFRPKGVLWRLMLAGHGCYLGDAAMRGWLQTRVPAGYFSRRGFLLRHHP